jgi:hypothetical protein
MGTTTDLGHVAGFTAAVDALHQVNTDTEEHHAALAAAAVAALPANRVQAATEPGGGEAGVYGAGR